MRRTVPLGEVVSFRAVGDVARGSVKSGIVESGAAGEVVSRSTASTALASLNDGGDDQDDNDDGAGAEKGEPESGGGVLR